MLQPANNQVILGGVDYSGVPGSELRRVIIEPILRRHDAEASAAVFMAAFEASN